MILSEALKVWPSEDLYSVDVGNYIDMQEKAAWFLALSLFRASDLWSRAATIY
jgi:hypothetical protein